MRAAKQRSRSSFRAVSVRGPGGEKRLTGGFAFRYRSREQFDQRVDRVCLREIDAALERRLDETTNDLGSADRFAMLQTNVNGQAIEIGDVAVQKDDRNLRPRLRVYDGSSTIAALGCWAHTLSFVQRRF